MKKNYACNNHILIPGYMYKYKGLIQYRSNVIPKLSKHNTCIAKSIIMNVVVGDGLMVYGGNGVVVAV